MTATTFHDQTLPAATTERRAPADARAAGVVSLIGVALSVLGAALLEFTQGDLFGGLETSSPTELARHLDQTAGSTGRIVTALSVWLVAFPLAALGGILLSRLSPPSVWTQVSRLACTAAVGAMPVFLVVMMTFVVVLAPAHAGGEDVLTLARAFGFTGSTIDWIVTALTLGIGPTAAVIAGRSTWVPHWLYRCTLATLAVTVVELVALAADNRDLVFILVPVGLAHLAAAAIVALRHPGSPALRSGSDEGGA
jgi:hypothetical protein